MGWIKDQTGSYAGGLLLLSALGIIAMGIVLTLGHDEALNAPRSRRRSNAISANPDIETAAVIADRIRHGINMSPRGPADPGTRLRHEIHAAPHLPSASSRR